MSDGERDESGTDGPETDSPETDGPDIGGPENEDRDEAWKKDVQSGYDGLAEAYDDQRRPDEEIPIVQGLDEALDAGSRVLDAGCGGGRAVLETLADRHEVMGLDVSRSQLELACERVPAAALLQGDLTRLPLENDAVDGLCSLHAIIHVPRERHGDVFAEFARVLRPGGELLVTSGNGPWEGSNDDWLETGESMRWSFHGAERNRELLEAAGFTVTEETVLGDELGGGEWLFLRARLPE